MNLLSLAHFTMFLICIWLILFTLSKNPQAKQNKVSALLICCYAIWNFAYTFFQAAVSKDQAMYWFNIASFGWGSFASVGVWFSLVFAKREAALKKWYFYFLIFIIPALLIYLQWTGYLIHDLAPQTYGWEVIWSASIWPWLYYAYYISFMTFSFHIWFNIGRKAKYSYEKKQAQIIFNSGLIIFILGTVTDVLCPQFKLSVIPPLGPILILFWAIGMVYAITKYKLMVLTPAYAASDILSAMSDSLILIDPQGKIIEINNATLNLLGFSRNEIIAKPVETLFAEKVPSLKGAEWEKLLRDGSLQGNKLSYRAQSGANIPVSFSGSVMRDNEDHLIGIVLVARDMREILRLQENEREFMVAKARAEAFQERAWELQAAYEQLKATQAQLIQSDKLAAVGQLAGGVAHEINNPMGVILGFAQGIVKRMKADDPLYIPLKSIEREAIRCKKMVGNLLTFSRTGRTQVERVEVSQLIDETLSLIEAQTQVKDIEIVRKYEPGLPSITVNKNQLQQVFINICNNAVDAMPDGGRITIGAKRIESQIEFEISDTGRGMTEAVQKHIFEPFFTTKEVGKGTGLGLSLCYEIIQKHNGRIEVESKADEGSIFRIKLPINSR